MSEVEHQEDGQAESWQRLDEEIHSVYHEVTERRPNLKRTLVATAATILMAVATSVRFRFGRRSVTSW